MLVGYQSEGAECRKHAQVSSAADNSSVLDSLLLVMVAFFVLLTLLSVLPSHLASFCHCCVSHVSRRVTEI